MYQSLKIVQSAILRLHVGENVLRIAEVLMLTNRTGTWKRKELLSAVTFLTVQRVIISET